MLDIAWGQVSIDIGKRERGSDEWGWCINIGLKIREGVREGVCKESICIYYSRYTL